MVHADRQSTAYDLIWVCQREREAKKNKSKIKKTTRERPEICPEAGGGMKNEGKRNPKSVKLQQIVFTLI